MEKYHDQPLREEKYLTEHSLESLVPRTEGIVSVSDNMGVTMSARSRSYSLPSTGAAFASAAAVCTKVYAIINEKESDARATIKWTVMGLLEHSPWQLGVQLKQASVYIRASTWVNSCTVVIIKKNAEATRATIFTHKIPYSVIFLQW